MAKEDQKWMEQLFTDLNDLCVAGRFEEVDAMLDAFDIENAPQIRSCAMIRGTFCARQRHELKRWDAFRERLYKHLEKQGKDADRILQGLMGPEPEGNNFPFDGLL